MVDGKERLDALNNFKFENIENANNDIGIGNTCSSSVSFSIYMPPVSLENKEITIYEGLKIGNNIEYIKLGIFIITKQESDGEYTKYTGYDRMYNLEMGYFSELSFPSTDKAILEEICSQVGIEFATNITEPNSINEKPNGYTRREIVGYMAALQGKNAVINADGNLELRWYSNTDYKLDGNKYYEAGVTFTTSKNFIIQKLTCNNSSGNGEENTTITSGSGTTGIAFSNPFMTQEILDKVYEKIGGFTFRPLSIKFVGDFRLDVGDIITVSKGNVDYNVPIMQITHECDGGLISTVKSVGQSDSSNSNVSQGPLTKQMQRYYAELVIVNQALVNKLDVETAKITYATITELKAIDATVENLKATALTADMADLKYAKIDLTNIEAGSIKTAMIETGAIGTAQIADGSITDAKIVGVTANKITAGTIDAAQIEVVNLNAANITVGSINGVQIAAGAIDMSKLGSDVSSWISTTESNVDKALKDAGFANTNASSAVTAADSAVSIANGKSTSYYQKTAPTGGTYKVNDIWFDTDDGYKMYYWNGSAWSAAQYGSSAISANAITADKIAASAVTAGKIAASAITADKIAANAITSGKIAANAVTTAAIAAGAITTDKISASAVTAAKIAIADYTDYATINENIPTSAIAGRALISDGYLIKTLQSSSAMMLCDFTLLSFNSSDEIYYEYTIKGETSGSAFTTIWYYDSEKKYLSAISSSAYEVTTQDKEISGTLKPKNLPLNAAYFIVGITDATATKTQLYVKKAKFIRKSGTTLISDGAITTDKIVAQAVTGAKIAASTITANNIAANAVTADKINVSSLSAISANLGTITAGVIQSTNYVANSTGMKLNLATGVWDSKYFKINNTGEITASGGTIGSWNITDTSLYQDYENYRTYIQTAKSADTWVFSVQEKRDGIYYGNWRVTADGRMYANNKVVIDSSGKDTGSYIIMETWDTLGDKHQTNTKGLEYYVHNLTSNNYAQLQAGGLWFGNEAEANVRGTINLSSSNLMQTTFDIYRTKNANGVIKGWFNDTVFVMQDGWNNNAIYADWNGNFSCTGTKNRIVETENFGQVKMNAFETAGAYFADIMSGRIAADGKCVIYLDRKFAETIDRDCEYQVILTAVGKASELYVIKDEEYFTVYGQPATDFDCMVIGRQKGYVTSYADSVDFFKLGEEVSENAVAEQNKQLHTPDDS